MGKKIWGCDLGTTNSAVALYDNGDITIIANAEGGRTTPSVVSFKKDEVLVGKVAKNMMATNPNNTVYSIKRFMGKSYEDSVEDIKLVPYKVEKDGKNVKVNIDGKLYSPEEISSKILMKMRKTVEDYTGETMTDVVITVPAYFNDAERQATKDAGKIAGLNVVRIISEPTAAALAYGFTDTDADKIIAVCDLGGGTADFSILEIGGGVFEVLSTDGDVHWGGDNIDQILIDYVCDDFKASNGIDLRTDSMALQRIKEAVENAKISLSTSTSADVNLPFISADANGPKHLNITVTRAKFEQLIAPFVETLAKHCQTAVKESGKTLDEIADVILVGGTTRIPYVQEFIKKQFKKETLNKSVNPDECVAMGAAVQGSILAGETKDILLLDVTPLSLGIETMGGVCTKLIERNTTIPTKKSQIFSTASDSQTAVTIHVLQGEREFAKDNKTLGMFTLDGIAPAPRGIPQIEVTFDISSDSIVSVTAKDLGTGKEQHITVSNSSNLSDAEIDRMVKEAEANSEADKKAREKVEARNSAESMTYSVEKSLKEYEDKLTEEEKSKITDAIKDVRDNLDSDDLSDKVKKLEEASMIIGQKVYEAQSANQTAEGATNGAEGFDFSEEIKNAMNNGGAEPTDAEFKEV